MELELVYNEETQEWEQKKEPFITIEVETEEDFEFIGNAIAFYKKHMNEQEKPQTNADRIRAMSDEELAVLLADEIPHGDCHGCHFNCIYMDKGNFEDSCQNAWYGWLKQPVEDKNEN